jgi:hypothetical protein
MVEQDHAVVPVLGAAQRLCRIEGHVGGHAPAPELARDRLGVELLVIDH